MNDLINVDLTQIQKEVLIGSLLGDGHLSLDSKYPRLKIDRQALDKPYLDWEYNIFKNLCLSSVKEFDRYDKRYNKYYGQVSFRTRAVPAFLDFYNKWYPNNKRTVPFDLELSPLILAVWFADDGSIRNESRNNLSIKFSTDSFGEEKTNFLAKKLESRYNSIFHVYKKYKDKDQYFIKASTANSTRPLIKDIEPYIIEMGMIRKYNIWKDVSLDKKVHIGLPYKDRITLYKTILDLKDFSIININSLITTYNINSLRRLFNDFSNNGYLEKYESKDKFNLYHYRLTSHGKDFLEKELLEI